MIEANLIDFYYFKLYKTISIKFAIKGINICHFPGLSINIEKCTY